MATKAKGGFYVQNSTSNIIHFATIDKKLDANVRPNGELHDTLWVPSEYENDPNMHKMLARGTFVKVEAGDIIERETLKAEDDKIAEAELLAMASIDTSAGDDLVSVDCAATTKAGKRCSNKAFVTVKELEAGKPPFCHIHSELNPDDFVRDAEGQWALVSK